MFSTISKFSAINVLSGSGVGRMKKFTFEGNTFVPETLAFLAWEIKNGTLLVEYEPGKNYSSYGYGLDTIYLHFGVADSISREAMIVHEATHAMFDFQGKKMDIATSESLAYIAQCLYARANDPGSSDPDYRIYSEGDKDKVFEVGWQIAGKLLGNGNIEPDDVTRMRDAVSIHPFYASTATASANYDGYRRK
jgi:hypothetical protein